MITVSLCMVVQNNEAIIERCLNSVTNIVDEIIIVDMMSNDRTNEIARKFTDQIHLFEDDDEVAALNFSKSLATKDFILLLNPSEVLLENDRLNLIHLKQSLRNEIYNIVVDYQVGWDEKNRQKISRVFKRLDSNTQTMNSTNEYTPESVQLTKLVITDLPLTQSTQKNLQMYEQMLNNKIIFTSMDLFYYAKELSSNAQYAQSIKYFLQFLRSNQQFEEHNILACNYIANCYHELNLSELETTWLLKALKHGNTHPETCCRLAYLFMEKNKMDSAIYWYKEATQNKVNEKLINHNPSCTSWLPHLQLAVCYDRIGEYFLANHHNELAYQFYPTHPSILSNREYFSTLINKGS
ncbi:glycosyl transferase [Bacillus sp. AFS002410]|uniref:glycosyltransferase n=1 Tax=Bacillus sp. AFS002410 TaxID=2033481 RepID=UPI000BF1F49F|nr:glycosyltransferase [Bacillus sp. AFS002410]PEJ56098.1 glycosyl transferase [Bacillus sp. AFS002410]